MLFFPSDAAIDVLDEANADSFQLCNLDEVTDREREIARYIQLSQQHPGFHLLLADTSAILISESVRQQFVGLLGLFESQEAPTATSTGIMALDLKLQQWLGGTLDEDRDTEEAEPSASISGILTQHGFESTVALFQQYAGRDQALRVQFSYGSFDVFCSELAMYRIREKYRHASKDLIAYGYSQPSRSFWFSLQTPGFEDGFFDTGWPSQDSEQHPRALDRRSGNALPDPTSIHAPLELIRYAPSQQSDR